MVRLTDQPLNSEVRSQLDDPGRWLQTTPFLDLEDSRLRLRAQALTQLCKTDREKALALYGFVKRIPYAKTLKFSLRSPRSVLDLNRGDGLDKIGLLIALLRIAEIPARIRFMDLPGEVLRGMLSHVSVIARAVADIWVGNRWVATDTYIFDAAYMAAARERLEREGWEMGYGIHRSGASIWNGVDDAFLVGNELAAQRLAPVEEAVFDDPEGYVDSRHYRATQSFAHALRVSLMLPSIDRVIRELREDALSGEPSSRM